MKSIMISVYILNQTKKVLWVPDSIAHLPGPASKLASISGTGPHIEPNHTKALAGLFTAAWQHPCQCLGAWERELAACWGIQLLPPCCRSASPDLPPPWPAVCSPAALAPASARCKWACEGIGPSSWGVNHELQNIQPILPSSSQKITKGLPTWLILLRNGIKFYCN